MLTHADPNLIRVLAVAANKQLKPTVANKWSNCSQKSRSNQAEKI